MTNDAVKLSRNDRRDGLQRHLADLVADARHAGLSDTELRDAFQRAVTDHQAENDEHEEGMS